MTANSLVYHRQAGTAEAMIMKFDEYNFDLWCI